jgi:hypothetical protein
MIDIDTLSPEHQRFVKKQMRESDRKRKPKAQKPMCYGVAFDSKLEIEFAQQLFAFQTIWRIDSWMYHPIRVSLAPGCTYTPDFAARVNGEFVLFETKGSWKAKNARDSHTRLVIAQKLFPWWIWVAVTKDKHGFLYEVKGPLSEYAAGTGFAQVESSILRLQSNARSRRDTESDRNSKRGQAFVVEPSLALMDAADLAGR